jgi:hypothetical protein
MKIFLHLYMSMIFFLVLWAMKDMEVSNPNFTGETTVDLSDRLPCSTAVIQQSFNLEISKLGDFDEPHQARDLSMRSVFMLTAACDPVTDDGEKRTLHVSS